MKKLKELSSEELTELAGVDEDLYDISNEKIHRSAKEFIQEYKIVQGDSRVPTFRIYYEYNLIWRPYGKKLSNIEFFRQFSKQFQQRRIGRGRYYMIEEGIFSLDSKTIDDARRFQKEKKYKKPDKKPISKKEPKSKD